MANIMKDVARALGVELEEEFDIDDYGKYKLTKDGLVHWSNVYQDWVNSGIFNDLLKGDVKIIKPILTESEKEYLSAVIKPFSDKVIAIAKYNYYSGEEFIKIKVNQRKFIEDIDLPYFEKGTMYNGMALDKEYILEELGL